MQEDPSGRVVQEKSLVLTDHYDSSGCENKSADQILGDDVEANGFSARISPFVSEDSPTRSVITDTFDIAGPCPQAAAERAAKLARNLTVKDQVGRLDRQPSVSVSIAQDTSDQDIGVFSPPSTSAALISDVPPTVGVRQAENNENHARQERAKRCCVLKSIAIALFVNCIVIASLVAVGVCFSGSCLRQRQIESYSEGILPIGRTTPEQPTILSTEQTTLVPTPSPDPEISVVLPVTVLGEAFTVLGEAFVNQSTPPTTQTPTTSPLAIGATQRPTQREVFPPKPSPLRNCFDGDLDVDCHLTNGTSCSNLQPSARRQRCNLGKPLSQVEFSYHFLHCNPFGSSQQEASSCEEETRVRLSNPVNITCLDYNGNVSLVVYPTIVEPGHSFSVGATEGLLPEKIRCTVNDAVVSKEVQSVVVDTSGEVTLSLGDLFGGLRLESCDQTHGERLSCLADLQYEINIVNKGPSVYMTDVTFSLQRALDLHSRVTLNMTDQVMKPFPQSHSANWAIRARVSVCTESALRAILAVEVVDPYKVGVYCGATYSHRGPYTGAIDEQPGANVSVDGEAPIDHPSSIEFGPQVSPTIKELEGRKQKRRGLLVAVIVVCIIVEITLATGLYFYCKRWCNTNHTGARKDEVDSGEEEEKSSMAELR